MTSYKIMKSFLLLSLPTKDLFLFPAYAACICIV